MNLASLESYVPAEGLGTYGWKDIGCRAAFTESEAVTYTLSHTHKGKKWFSAGDGEPSCVLFVTGPTAKERRAR